MPMYHPTPSQARLATQLTEEEQIRIAQRIGLIQHLPKGVYDGGQDGSEKKIREWALLVALFTQECWGLSFAADLPLKASTVWKHVTKYLNSNMGACFSPCFFIWSEIKPHSHAFFTKLDQLVILFYIPHILHIWKCCTLKLSLFLYFQMRDLYAGLCLRRPYPIPALHAHLPHGLYRRLADAILHLSLLHGARGCRPALHLRDQLMLHLSSQNLDSKKKKKEREKHRKTQQLLPSCQLEGSQNTRSVFLHFGE